MGLKLATRTQRFLAYLIDFGLISLIASNLILPFFYKRINFDTSVASSSYGLFLEEFRLYFANDGSLEVARNALLQYLRVTFTDTLFTILFTVVLLAPYLIILPKFWSKQTLGRMLTKTKVVKKSGENIDFKDILKRELLGCVLMYVILNNLIGGGFIIASVVLAYIDGRSLADYIANTCLISLKDDEGEYPNAPVEANPLDEIIDAKVEEINKDNNDDNSNDEYTII